MAKPTSKSKQRSTPAAKSADVTYEFKAFDEKGFLCNFVCTTHEDALQQRQKLYAHYQRKLKVAVSTWEHLTKVGATDFEFGWSAAGGREKPTIEKWMLMMTPVTRVTREVLP